MSTETAQSDGVHRTRLFAGICLSLIPTGASFALVANVLGQLKAEFILTNYQVGTIAGAGLWGMAISLLVIGPWLDKYGMKNGAVLAFVGHLGGLTLMLAAATMHGDPSAYWLLILGAALLAGGNGMIEVVGNPLTTALFPDDKTTKLNWFHAFFPIGILAGSLTGFALNGLQESAPVLYHWTFQIGIVYVPILIYGIMILPQKFPKTEYGEAGLPFGEMFRFALTQPLMYLLVFMLVVSVSIELGAQRWIPEIFANAGLGAWSILLLAWVSVIMIVMRLYAAPFVERFSPPGMLFLGAIVLGISLVLYSIAQGGFVAFLAATCFGVGVAFFFPTIVGLVSERLPHSGSFGVVLTIGVGLAAAGGVATPGIGRIADVQLAKYIANESPDETIALLREVDQSFPPLIEEAETATEEELLQMGYRAADLANALELTRAALSEYDAQNAITGDSVPKALRAITEVPVDSDLVARAAGIIKPAEGWGGKRALLLISPFTLILIAVFGAMYLNDQKKGGYKALRLSGGGQAD